MAKDGDIIDTMSGGIFELIGWIFNMLIKLSIALIEGLFSLIGSDFRRYLVRVETQRMNNLIV
jgi:hypothetical protein